MKLTLIDSDATLVITKSDSPAEVARMFCEARTADGLRRYSSEDLKKIAWCLNRAAEGKRIAV